MVNGQWSMVKAGLIHSPLTTYYSPLFNYPQEVRDFGDDAAHGGRVGALERLVQLGEADAAHDVFLRLREADGAAVILDFNPTAVAGLAFQLFSHLSKPRDR